MSRLRRGLPFRTREELFEIHVSEERESLLEEREDDGEGCEDRQDGAQRAKKLDATFANFSLKVDTEVLFVTLAARSSRTRHHCFIGRIHGHGFERVTSCRKCFLAAYPA